MLLFERMLAYLFPVALGSMAVLQAAFNRQIATRWGLGPAIFLNSLMLLLAAGIVFVLARMQSPLLPSGFRDRGSFTDFKWWYTLPGLFGFALVTGIPWAMHRLGALKVFVSLIGAQLVASLIWDALVENRPVTLERGAGAVLAFLAALLVGRQS